MSLRFEGGKNSLGKHQSSFSHTALVFLKVLLLTIRRAKCMKKEVYSWKIACPPPCFMQAAIFPASGTCQGCQRSNKSPTPKHWGRRHLTKWRIDLFLSLSSGELFIFWSLLHSPYPKAFFYAHSWQRGYVSTKPREQEFRNVPPRLFSVCQRRWAGALEWGLRD